MLEKGKARKLVVYVSESDTRHGRPVYQLLVELAHRHGLAGATVVRGLMGFGAGGTIHASHPDLASKLPVRVEIIDSAEAIEAVLADVHDVVADGLIELSDVDVVMTRPRADATAAPVPAHVKLEGKAQLWRIFVDTTDRARADDIVELLLELDIAGATVLPGVILVVDTEEKLMHVKPVLDELMPAGLVVQSDVDVVFYRPTPT
jgi:PII-like signaling protein